MLTKDNNNSFNKQQDDYAIYIKKLIIGVLEKSNVTNEYIDDAIYEWVKGDNGIKVYPFLPGIKYQGRTHDYSKDIKTAIFKLFYKVYPDLVFSEILDNWKEGVNDELTYNKLKEEVNQHKPMVIQRM